MAIDVVDVLFPSDRQRRQPFLRSLSRLESDVKFGTGSLKAVVAFDAVVSKEHQFSSQVTDNPVEDGTTVTDHVILAPRQLTLEAMVSDHPIDPEVLAKMPTPTEGPDGLPVAVKPTRSQKAAEFLEGLWRDKVLLKVVTKFRTYANLVIESMTWREENDVGEALQVTLQLREIRIASSAVTQTAQLLPTKSDLAAGKVERGKKPKQAKPEKAESIRSAAQQAGVLP